MQTQIRLRASLALIKDRRILLVPHYSTDVSSVQWTIPGGSVNFGESLEQTALRELEEETGLQANIEALLEISEVIKPKQLWHSITVTYLGHPRSGTLRSEPDHPYGDKTPRWFSMQALAGLAYHPPSAVDKALAFAQSSK